MTVKRIRLWSADRKPGARILTQAADCGLQDAADHSPQDQTGDVDPWRIDVSSRDGLIVLSLARLRLVAYGWALFARSTPRPGPVPSVRHL